MKILHTSDWHIGKKLYKQSLEDDHRDFFDKLILIIEQQKIDLLIISGDIFDIAYPSNSSLKLYYEFLTRLIRTNCNNVIITGGNHDSASTLEAPKEILHFLNIEIIGAIPNNIEDLIFEITKNNETVVVCAVPFLRDSDVRISVAGEDYNSRKNALKDGISNYYKNISDTVYEKYKSKFPVIATGHLFLTGVSTSESERDIHIGTIDGISVDKLPAKFDYWALGHIHRPQIVNKKEHIRYSGSPIPLSFSEKNDKKQVIVIETKKNTISNIETVNIPSYRKLIKISGTYNEVFDKISNYNSGEVKDRAEILITEPNYLPTLISEFENFIKTVENLEILKYKVEFKDIINGTDELYEENQRLADLNVVDVFKKKLENENITGNAKTELQDSFNELLSNLHNESEELSV